MLRSTTTTLLKDLNIVFSFLDNVLYIRYKGFFSVYKLPYFRVFFHLVSETRFLSSNLKLLFFIKHFSEVYKIFHFFYMFARIVNNQSSLIVGFYRILDLVGLGFRITKITDSIFLFDMGFSCGIYFIVPKGVKTFYSPSLKKLLIFSFDLQSVSDVVSSLLLLRGPHVYKVRGFIDSKTIVRLRTGKQR